MHQPAIGRIVHVLVNPACNNGSDVAPAVITRVWRDGLVNLRVQHDAIPTQRDWMTSVPLLGTRAEAEAFQAERWGHIPGWADRADLHRAAFWPVTEQTS